MLRGAAYWNRRTYLLFVTLWVFLALLDLLGTFWGSWGSLHAVDRVAVVLIAVPIGMIAFFGLKHVRELDELSGQVEEKALDRLSRNAFAMGILGCGALQAALTLLHPLH
jgi:hypothetical protein